MNIYWAFHFFEGFEFFNPVFLTVVGILEKRVGQKLVKWLAISRILFKTFRNNVSKFLAILWGQVRYRPCFDLEYLHMYIELDVVSELKWWVSHCKLESKATECPNIHSFRVPYPAINFWSKIDGWPFNAFSVLILLSQKDAKTHIGYLDVTIWSTKNIGSFDISV